MTLNSVLFYRSLLDPYDQAIYDDLLHHWIRLDDSFTIKLPHSDLSVLSRAIHLDNPILFYVNFYKLSYARLPLSLRIQSEYFYSKAEIQRYLNDCENWGLKIIKKIPAIGICEKALWLHDVILANVRYGNSNGINAHNLIGVIREKEAVCEGISKAYKFLCDLASIPCIVVSGTLDKEPHGWNMLWIDGGTSFVDVTNDIRYGSGYGRHHFLRSSVEMKGYSWDSTLIPDCKVHNKSNAFFTVHNKQEFLRVLRQNINLDSIAICLQFDNHLDDAAISRLINKYLLFYPALATREIAYSKEQQIIYISKK